MVLFTAYFDASGDWNQPFVIVAGYIANLWQWKSLENVWPNIHKEYGVQTPFHMADFIAACTTETYARQKNARPDYVEIAKDKERANAFLKSPSRGHRQCNRDFSPTGSQSVAFELVNSLIRWSSRSVLHIRLELFAGTTR